MNKVLGIILASFLVLTACGNDDTPAPTQNKSYESVDPAIMIVYTLWDSLDPITQQIACTELEQIGLQASMDSFYVGFLGTNPNETDAKTAARAWGRVLQEEC